MEYIDFLFDVISPGSGGGGREPVIASLTATENGTYTAPAGVDGYSPVTVDVQAEDTLSVYLSNELAGPTYRNETITALRPYACAGFNRPQSDPTRIVTWEFPNALEIGTNAFASNKEVVTFSAPKIQAILSDTFNSAQYLENVDCPLVSTIGSRAFTACSMLHTLRFESATTIQARAFLQASNLSALILPGSTVVSLADKNAFDSTPISSGTGYIYVPAALVDQYAAATNWTNFAARIRALEDYTVDGTTTGELDPSKI